MNSETNSSSHFPCTCKTFNLSYFFLDQISPNACSKQRDVHRLPAADRRPISVKSDGLFMARTLRQMLHVSDAPDRFLLRQKQEVLLQDRL